MDQTYTVSFSSDLPPTPELIRAIDEMVKLACIQFTPDDVKSSGPPIFDKITLISDHGRTEEETSEENK